MRSSLYTPIPPTSEDFEHNSHDRPLLYKFPEVVHYQQPLDGCEGVIKANTGHAVEFETELFVGRVAIWVLGVPSTPPNLFEVSFGCLPVLFSLALPWNLG